jgi:hypothetical protein
MMTSDNIKSKLYIYVSWIEEDLVDKSGNGHDWCFLNPGNG